MVVQDGVVMAVDSRGTGGNYSQQTTINDDTQKVFAFGSRCGIALAGTLDLGTAIIREARAALAPLDMRAPDVDEAARVISDVARQFWERNRLGQLPPDSRQAVLFLVGGLTADGSPRVYVIISQLNFTPQCPAEGYGVIGLPLFGMYWLNRVYSPGMDPEKGTSLASFIVAEAASQDGRIGGTIRTLAISRTSGTLMGPHQSIPQAVDDNVGVLSGIRDALVGGVLP